MVIAGGKDIDETVVLTERGRRRDKFLHLVFYFTSFQLSVDAACMLMTLWCQLGLIADAYSVFVKYVYRLQLDVIIAITATFFA
jgi:hypothetical protein